jgi:hypothetical protein
MAERRLRRGSGLVRGHYGEGSPTERHDDGAMRRQRQLERRCDQTAGEAKQGQAEHAGDRVPAQPWHVQCHDKVFGLAAQGGERRRGQGRGI